MRMDDALTKKLQKALEEAQDSLSHVRGDYHFRPWSTDSMTEEEWKRTVERKVKELTDAIEASLAMTQALSLVVSDQQTRLGDLEKKAGTKRRNIKIAGLVDKLLDKLFDATMKAVVDKVLPG